MNKLVHVFYDINMSNSHRGLKEICKKKIDTSGLRPGDMVVFINKNWTALKAFAGNENFLVHHKMQGSKHINPDTIVLLPLYVKGAKLEYDEANREAVTSRYRKWLKSKGQDG
jgi:hypothetical protein